MKKATWIAAAILMLLTSCHKDETTETEGHDSATMKRTVLVYVAGDNDLTNGMDFFSSDLKQMMQGTQKLPDGNNLILFVDRAGQKPYFLKVEKGDTIRLRTMDTEMKSSDAETLYEAMKYTVGNFPATSYGLVLWGHADGWITRSAAPSYPSARSPKKAYGQDKTGNVTWMNITDMAKVLARPYDTGTEVPRLAFILADCCCFLCVENVYELRGCADYIIGSPAEIPGEGAPYHTVVPTMFSQDSTFYKQIIDLYYAQKSNGYDVPLAAVRTSELEELAQATATTLATIAPAIEPDGDGCRYPDVDSLIFYYNHTQFDMQDFMLRYASPEQYTEWKRAFDKAVLCPTFAKVWMSNHVKYSNSRRDSFGDFESVEERMGVLGMFVPQRDTDAAKWIDQQFNYIKIDYLGNLGVNMTYLNNNVKKMQWYDAARLAEFGW